MLSGGTDGIDGPTPAAGAVWRTESNILADPEAARASLERNDSYSFLREIYPGQALIGRAPALLRSHWLGGL